MNLRNGNSTHRTLAKAGVERETRFILVVPDLRDQKLSQTVRND